MNCPKCNSTIDNKSIKCPECGSRIGRLCPTCKAYNNITNKNCTECGEVLLKICPNCRSINLPSSEKCRRCNYDLDTQPEVRFEEMSYNANYCSLASAKETIMASIKANNIKVISINGNNELGKNYVFKTLMKETSAQGIAWLMGKCTPHTQLTPLGYIQSVLLNLFNVTNFCTNKKQLKKESIKFFKQDFQDITTNEIYDLLNILYPENIDKFQNIQANKQNSIKIIIKIFETILTKMNAVLIVENIEYIDSFSYEILNVLIENELIREKLTIILTFVKEQSGINCITSPCLTDTNYADVSIIPFSKEQIEPIFDAYKDIHISKDLKAKIMHYGNENPILIEQLINMVVDVGNSIPDIKLTDNLVDVLKYRLELLKNNDYNTYLLLIAVSILGFKFHSVILNSIFDMNLEEIEKRIHKLIKMNILVPAINIGYEFKTLNIWNNILELAKEDTEIFRAVNQALYPLTAAYTLSTSAILAYIAQNLEFQEQTIEIWNKCAQFACYIGDTGLYIILQKQILNLIDNISIENSTIIKRDIYSELGKLLEQDNPELAMEYLPKAIIELPEEEFIEKIELLGYLASASMKTKNYHGVIECINNAVALIPDNFVVETALLKTREIKALEKIGNAGALVNIVDNDIIPILENALNNKISSKIVSYETIFDAWIKTNLSLAIALISQGDNRAFKILENITNTCNINKIEDINLIIKINTYMAFANTITGNIRTSIKILDEILSEQAEIDTYAMSLINLVSVLNRFFMNKDDLSYDELFQATQYADDINDEFTKNILKLLLGRLMQDRTSAKEAMNVYAKQIEYFAEKQNAIGVLLGWYFISEAKMKIDGPQAALDIATKALDIAQSANISNHYFILLLDKLMGEIYLALQDYDSAKMYIEKALLIAKNYEIKYQLAELYLLYAKYLQDYALISTNKKVDLILSAQQMIKKSSIIADDLKLVSLLSSVEKSTTILNSFCQMNGIVLK